MKNIMIKKGLVIGIILVFFGISCFPSIAQTLGSSEAKQAGKNQTNTILLYATWDGSKGYPKSEWTDLARILESHGCSVTLTDRSETQKINASLLSSFNELWFIDSAYSYSFNISEDEVTTILNYRLAGHGLLITADHTDPGGGGFKENANEISCHLGVIFYLGFIDGDGLIYPNFAAHPLFVGVKSILGTYTDALMEISSPAKSVATHFLKDIIAVLDDGTGRVVFDNTFARFQNGNVPIGDNAQYACNIADWLSSVGNPAPSTPIISGPTHGVTDMSYNYTFNATDPVGENISYYIEWGDGANNGWIGPCQSGEEIIVAHTWNDSGFWRIRCKAKDVNNTESDWGTLHIIMPYKPPRFPFLYWLLDRFPNAFSILLHLMGY